MTPTRPAVTVCTVTWNSREQIDGYFRALDELRPAVDVDVVVVDCASSDDSVTALEESRHLCRWPVTVVALDENLGFAGGMNRAIEQSDADWVWALNPDARPESDALDCMIGAWTEEQPLRFGSVTPRIVRESSLKTPRIDACGMRLTTTWRHLDRASGEIDQGQYQLRERVFGGTGAATLYRREALDDVALHGLAFDEDFHSFREDAELAFRLQEREWECLYAPLARVRHRRFNLPDRRRAMPSHVNLHSLKNRYLLRLYHQTAGNFARTFLPTLWRDVLALGYVLLVEHTSLGAYRWLWQNRRRLLERRRELRARRTAPNRAVNRWFRRDALPLPTARPST
ncbi:MAG: glycosyltransferase [Acidobacteriota bacterium]